MNLATPVSHHSSDMKSECGRVQFNGAAMTGNLPSKVAFKLESDNSFRGLLTGGLIP
jgi:hypothetical protein